MDSIDPSTAPQSTWTSPLFDREEINGLFPKAEVVVWPLDLADLDSVRKFAEKCLAEARIDLLVNNAGLMMPKQGAKTKQGFEVINDIDI